MSQRKQFLITLLVIACILAGLAVHFLFYLRESLNNPSGALPAHRRNALIIRFRTFDSIIAGTSVGHNFKCSDFDKITGGFSYKLTANAARIPQTCRLIDFACEKHRIRSALLDMHPLFLIKAPPEEGAFGVGRYYHGNTLLQDLADGVSLWSLKDREKYYKNKRFPKNRSSSGWSRDDLYRWDTGKECSRAALAYDTLVKNHLERNEFDIDLKYLPYNIHENLMPLFRRHPEVTFYLFLPPFAPFAYVGRDYMLLARKAVMDNFLTLPNVRLYDFQGCPEICMDFDQYKDATHYSAKTSEWILEQIKEDNFRVTPQNRSLFDKRFSDMLKNFDAEKEKNALKEELDRKTPRKE